MFLFKTRLKHLFPHRQPLENYHGPVRREGYSWRVCYKKCLFPLKWFAPKVCAASFQILKVDVVVLSNWMWWVQNACGAKMLSSHVANLPPLLEMTRLVQLKWTNILLMRYITTVIEEQKVIFVQFSYLFYVLRWYFPKVFSNVCIVCLFLHRFYFLYNFWTVYFLQQISRILMECFKLSDVCVVDITWKRTEDAGVSNVHLSVDRNQ